MADVARTAKAPVAKPDCEEQNNLFVRRIFWVAALVAGSFAAWRLFDAFVLAFTSILLALALRSLADSAAKPRCQHLGW
jgi:hypothetical protein